MPPRRKTKAGVANALLIKEQPGASQSPVTITPSSTTTCAPAANSPGSTVTGGQTLPNCLQNFEPKSAVPNGSRNAPKPRQRRKPKNSEASTLPTNIQPGPCQSSAAKKPCQNSLLISPQRGDVATTMASVPLSEAPKALKSKHCIPSTPANLRKQREKVKIGEASSSLGSMPPKTYHFSRTTTQSSTAPFTSALEGPKALEPNKTSPNLSKSPIVQSHKKKKNTAWKTSWMTKDAGELVRTIPSASIQAVTTAVSSEFGFENMCSYNWQEDGSIVVPGAPPKWAPPSLPVTLSPDVGNQFVDQNAFRMPKFPFEPAFQALSTIRPQAKLDDVDIIVNRNSLRKFLDFAAGRQRDPWRMDLHVVKDTLFISRKEMNARAMVRGAANSGYGHNFEKAFTKPGQGLENSSSHHRVIRYRLGSLECAVRFEVDAYYEDPNSSDSTDPTHQLLDQITTTMAQLKTDEPQSNTSKKGGTRVIMRGNHVDSSKLAEIKTRKRVNLNEALPQLWFGRTPYLLTGKHDKGIFNSVDCSHVLLQFADWEKSHQETLRKMVSVLTELRRTMKDTNLEAAILVCDKGGPLQLYRMKTATGVLPRDMIKKYWSTANEEEGQ